MTTVLKGQFNRIAGVGFLVIGAIVEALATALFYVPADIAPGGISGVTIIIDAYIDIPIGMVGLLLNIPLLIIAYRVLGGWRFIAGTVLGTVVYSFALDLFILILPATGITTNALLNAIFGGVVGGIGTGLLLRGDGTTGGTSILARILQVVFGFPMSSALLYADGIVLAAAGLTFGWDAALLAVVALYIGGEAADYVLDGPSVIRTVTIVTTRHAEIAAALQHQLGRGVTAWKGRGMYTGQERDILFVAVSRVQVSETRRIAHRIDPGAFIVVEQGHAAYGEGFKVTPVPADESDRPTAEG